MKNRILILVPPLNRLGGVALHYKGLANFWNEDVSYFETFKTSNKKKWHILPALCNYLVFIITLLIKCPHIIVINISLKQGFFSKNLYISISRIFQKKIIIFIHGWDIEKEYLLSKSEAKSIFKCNGFIVLSKLFKEHLSKYVSPSKIYLTTTKVDDSLIRNYDNSLRTGHIKNILFLSRIEKEKGIFIAIDTYKQLLIKHPNLKLSIVGDGTAMNEVRQLIKNLSLKNATIYGRLSGDELINAFLNADIFIFPTYGEGMPGALLEAMSFGLPVITRPVGGIPDFFINGEMGLLTDSLNAADYSRYIEYLIDNPQLVLKISHNNYNYAKKHFMASIVAKNMEEIFNQITNK